MKLFHKIESDGSRTEKRTFLENATGGSGSAPKGSAINGSVANGSAASLLKAALFLAVFLLLLAMPVRAMGLGNLLSTMMNTAYRLLIDTCLYIMALAVLAGAVSALLAEFGVLELLNRVLSPLMKPLWGMPGAAALGLITTYLSDNPAILTLANDKNYRQYFKAYQIPALTNLGTAFGMGLIVTSNMLGLPSMEGKLGAAVICGNLGAVAGSILCTRLMLGAAKKNFGPDLPALEMGSGKADENCAGVELSGARAAGLEDDTACGTGATASAKSGESFFLRVMNALLRGGKVGVDMGLGIIPGVCIICTIVMMLTNGPSEAGVYTGAAYEGIQVLPWIGEKLQFILTPLFGFSSSACVSVPVTALGSAGAALGTVRTLAGEGLITAGDVAVFTGMCMCWSGYLSTHCSMMDVLGCRNLVGKSILFHTLGGLLAGVTAHLLFLLF